MIHRSEESKDQLRYGKANIDYYIKRSKRITDIPDYCRFRSSGN